MNEALRQYLATADPLGSGLFVAGQIALGFHALLGKLPMPCGAAVLKRRRLYPEPGDWEICGTASTTASSISNAAAPHQVGMAYHYAACRIFGNAYGSPLSEPVRIDFDDAGDLIDPPVPNWPTEVVARPVSGGTFLVTWTYPAWGKAGTPVDFQVFEGATAETVDYESLLGTVSFTAGRNRFEFTTGAYADGTEHVFAVRARNVDGVSELNVFTTDAVTAEASTPPAATIVSAKSRQAGE